MKITTLPPDAPRYTLDVSGEEMLTLRRALYGASFLSCEPAPSFVIVGGSRDAATKMYLEVDKAMSR